MKSNEELDREVEELINNIEIPIKITKCLQSQQQRIHLLEKAVPKQDVNDLDITQCKCCGEEIVINIGDLDYPICCRLKCFKFAFPDDYEQLMKDIKESSTPEHKLEKAVSKQEQLIKVYREIEIELRNDLDFKEQRIKELEEEKQLVNKWKDDSQHKAKLDNTISNTIKNQVDEEFATGKYKYLWQAQKAISERLNLSQGTINSYYYKKYEADTGRREK